ncbi:GntR family transcriptional regulator [Pusillimonas sp. ANT_WB101]|uniref:GntR family transcriptional regulator n=1 Tax=Pusillimonas sp. ANT_WB101 TaxID=2597356 RepID=UPI0011ED659B|nr:GntR family transcriptional regulator [Pusillimonas sp. ANT_WB101]KAA0892884.1 GntR family transcriptional regulator [Pusillimonas sp. ANT_WB101]
MENKTLPEVTSTARGTRTLSAVTRLRELIVSGVLKPGQRISERSVLEEHQDLSRTPLREALKILASEGLIDLTPNRGAFVTRLSMKHIDSAMEVLIGLESIAAVASCARITAPEMEEIKTLHHQMLVSFQQQDLMSYFQINQQIHQLIVDGAHNEALSRIYRAESLHIRRYRYAGNIEHARWEQAVTEHEQIIEALCRRDGLLLRELLRAHHSKGWDVTRELLATELK